MEVDEPTNVIGTENATVRALSSPSKALSPNQQRNGNMMVSSFSNMANQAISRGQYREALSHYQKALEDYSRESPTVVQLVNAAATCFNLGALSKKLQDYNSAAKYFRQAENIYRNCQIQVRQIGNGGKDRSSSSSSCNVCLIQLIVETLQARAHLHYKYQNLLEKAIECHEEVVEILEQHRLYGDDIDTVQFKIKFQPLLPEQRWELLVTSLQFLGKFYVEKGDLEDGLMAYQEVLKILEDQDELDTQHRQEETIQIIRALEEIHADQQPDMHESNAEEASEMQRMALLEEDDENWDKALIYWERVLYFQSQEYGEESFEVGIALCQVARVMVAQGNHEGGLDLYQAATLKYRNSNNLLPNHLITNAAHAFLVLQQPLEALAWLEDLASQSVVPEEKALILYELGKIYLEQGQLHESSRVLCESAELGEGDEEHVFALLQKVEFLQQRRQLNSPDVAAAMALEAINEGTDEEASAVSTVLSKDKIATSMSKKPLPIDFDGEEKKLELEDVLGPIYDDKSEPGQLSTLSPKNAMSSKSELGSLLEVAEEEESGESDEEPQVAQLKDLTASLDKSDGADESAVIDQPDMDSIPDIEEMNGPLSSPIHMPVNDPTDSDILISASLESLQFEDDDYKSVSAASHPPMDGNVLFGDEEGEPQHKILESRSHVSQLPEVTPSDESFRGALPSEAAERAPSQSTDGPATLSRAISDASTPHSLSQHDLAITDSPSEGMMSSGLSGIDTISLGTTLFVSAEGPEPVSDNNAEAQSQTIDDEVNDHADDLPKMTISDVNVPAADSSPAITYPATAGPSPAKASPADSETSRTGLLKTEQKGKPSPASKGLRLPSLSSPRNPTPHAKTTSSSLDFKNPILRIKRDYAEMPRGSRSESSQASKSAPRKGFVKALASQFKRSRSKRATGLGALDEDKVVGTKLPSEFDDDFSQCDAPVHFIFDDDDASQVSQITFRMEEYSSRKTSQPDGQWWWGVTKEGLEGWFPSEYVTQAVQAAEGFLSAKSIHDLAKSRPLDFDSDEESEAGDERPKESTVGPITTEDLDSQLERPAPLSNNARAQSASTRGTQSNVSSGPNTTQSSKKQTLVSKIEEKESMLQTQIGENGSEHVDVATTLFDLAVLKGKNNNFDEALELAQQSLQSQKSTLNMSDACKTLHFLADLHMKQKKSTAAIACYEEAQRYQESLFGYFHEETAITLNRIGNVFATQGEFGLAMENYKEALRILKECCGEEVKNPLVSQTLIQIGAVYYRERNSLATIQSKVDGYSTFIEGGMLEVIGRAHEERGSYRMALAFFEEKLQFLNDNENSDLEQVAETLNSLGMLSCRAGLFLEAIDYYDKALGIQMKLGCDEVQLAMARVLAGSVQYSLGHFSKALKLFQDAIDTLRDHVGSEQETVAATLFHMGIVRTALCEYDDAMSDFRDALDVQQKLLGNDHPATLRTRREIGNLYAVYESELDSAFEEFNDILEVQKRIHGERHPNVAETLQSIGCAQAKKGDHSAALRTLEDCYNMRLEFLGMDHPLQATTLHEIAKIQLGRGRLKKAMHIVDAALNIRVESLSEQHIDVAMALATKASCLVAQNSFVEATKLFLEALSISQAAVGPIHPCGANIHEQIGIMHLRKCHFEEAAAAINKALEIYRQSNLDEDHPGIKGALEELERVERAEMLCV
ncbi:unnamed protein product [Cylindrotheca closterium]|uniref:Uncharacterized protein n=1 Tax=Cylindrotheca closterium TaxID=2856 RepID=A0AAD2FL65_9STRA|nr:unnamed protein product [Cylindrotheca closterium]